MCVCDSCMCVCVDCVLSGPAPIHVIQRGKTCNVPLAQWTDARLQQQDKGRGGERERGEDMEGRGTVGHTDVQLDQLNAWAKSNSLLDAFRQVVS